MEMFSICCTKYISPALMFVTTTFIVGTSRAGQGLTKMPIKMFLFTVLKCVLLFLLIYTYALALLWDGFSKLLS